MKIQKVSRQEAQEVLQEVDLLVATLADSEVKLDHGYARLGALVCLVQQKEYWRGEYDSFGQYINELKSKFNRGKTQLYAYVSTVKALLPYAEERELDKMGIAKANVIKRAIKQLDTAPSAEIIKLACDPNTTAQDVRKAMFEGKHEPEDEKGIWRQIDFDGYYSEEEFETLKQAVISAKRTDPVINLPLDWQVRKEVLIRFAQEYLAGHPEEV